jgi:phytoene dehydrogenase-like protein
LYWYLENEFIPKHVKTDIAGNERLNVSEAHTQRIHSAQNELPGWKVEQATISSKRYKDLLHFYNWRRQIAEERARMIYGNSKDVDP